MSFIMSKIRETEPVRYDKVRLLLPDNDDKIRPIRDKCGEILQVRKTYFMFFFTGFNPDRMRLSGSGNRVILFGPSWEEWPKKKAAVFYGERIFTLETLNFLAYLLKR